MFHPWDHSQRNGLPPLSTCQKQLLRLDHQRTRKGTSNPIINPETGLEIKKNILISVPYVPGIGEEFGKNFPP